MSLETRTKFIAEIGSNFDGSIERALYLIELAKESGADIVKFQHFSADTLVSEKSFSKLKDNKTHQSMWKGSVAEVYKKAEFGIEWTEVVANKCTELGVKFMSSPYTYESINELNKYCDAFKIGSGDITYKELIKEISSKHKHILLATGASNQEEVDDALAWIGDNSKVTLMQCNTNYTGNDDENLDCQNISVLSQWKQRYPNIKLGLSCHLKSNIAVLGAVSLGATVIEKHFTDDNNRNGPDHGFAQNPDEFRDMVNQVRCLEKCIGDGIKKVERNEVGTRRVQRRSLHYRSEKNTGEILKREDITAKRPYIEKSISPADIDTLVGLRLVKSVQADDMIVRTDLG